MHFTFVERDVFYGFLHGAHPTIIDNIVDIMYTAFNHTADVILVTTVGGNAGQGDQGTYSNTTIRANEQLVADVLIRSDADVTFLYKLYDHSMYQDLGLLTFGAESAVGIVGTGRISKSVGDVVETFLATDPRIWFMVSLSLLVVALFNMAAAGVLHQHSASRQTTSEYNLLNLLGLLLYQGSSRKAAYACTRLLLVFFLFFGMVFICFLYADLKTSVTIVRPKFFESLLDLVDNKRVAVVLFQSPVSQVFHEHSTVSTYREVWKRMNMPGGRVFDGLARRQVFHRDMELMGKQRLVYVGGMEDLGTYGHFVCDLPNIPDNTALFKEKLPGLHHFFVTKKNLEPEKREHLKKITLRLQENALLYPLEQKILDDVPLCLKKSTGITELTMESLPLASLINTLKLLFIGLAISGVTFLGEICTKATCNFQ